MALSNPSCYHMRQLPNIILLAFLLTAVASCNAVDDTLLSEEVDDFARGVVTVTALIAEEFEIAEEINNLGFTDNLQFQLELGGSPETDLKPLFGATDIAARQNLLSALRGYAEMLAAVARGESISALYAGLAGPANDLKSLNSGSFNLSHSLSFLESNRLVSDVSFFDELFILPERDKRLLPIVEKGADTVKKTAILLYFDIGAKEDQSSKCSFTYPGNDLTAAISTLRLCKGGLRSIVGNAIAFDTGIWKDRLAYMKGGGSVNSGGRAVAINRLVRLQKLGQSLDRLLADTQSALAAMVAAHESIGNTLGATQKSFSLSLSETSKNLVFTEKVRALASAAADIKTALADITATSITAQEFQGTPQRNLLSGDSDDK